MPANSRSAPRQHPAAINNGKQAAPADTTRSRPDPIASSPGAGPLPPRLVQYSYTMLHYTGGQMDKVTLPVPSGMFLTLESAPAVPGSPRAFAVGGLWPIHGVTEAFTSAVIYAYGG